MYRLKPMNCPVHILIYKNSPKSYRDLPQRYAEFGNVYRYERSGTMHGLLRVRGFTQDDAHIFCTPEQIEGEVHACLDFAEAVLKTFGFKEYQVELSTWDPQQAGRLLRYSGGLVPSPLLTEKSAHRKRARLQDLPGRGGILRPQDRREARRRSGTPVAAFDRAV